jgi:hypothetical protein
MCGAPAFAFTLRSRLGSQARAISKLPMSAASRYSAGALSHARVDVLPPCETKISPAALLYELNAGGRQLAADVKHDREERLGNCGRTLITRATRARAFFNCRGPLPGATRFLRSTLNFQMVCRVNHTSDMAIPAESNSSAATSRSGSLATFRRKNNRSK